jgi:signal transduction histidine kinase
MNRTVYFRRGLTYVLLVVTLTLVVFGLTLATKSIITFDTPVVLALFIVLVAVLLNPLRDLLQRGIDQYLLRRPVTLDELVNAYSEELTAAADVDQLVTTLFKYIAIAVPEATPQLYLPDEAQGGFAPYGNQNERPLDMASPLVQFLSQESGVIDLTEERAWPKSLREHGQEVAALSAEIILPLNSGQELLGWLVLAHEERGAGRFQQSELNYFRSLANQSLIGLERASVIRRLEARISELDLLSKFSQYLNFTVVADDLLELIYTHYQRLLGIEDFYVYLKDPVSQTVYTVFCVEGDERIPRNEGLDQTVDDPLILQVIETGQMATTDDDQGYTRLILPLNAGTDTLGALHTFKRRTGFQLPQQQEQLVTVFADRTAVALERLHTRQQLEIRAQQLEIINQITFSLASTLELTPLLDLILDNAIELLKTEAGTFMLTEEDTGELEFRVVRGPSSHDLIGTRLPVGTGLAGTAAQTGRPVLVNRVQEDTRWFDQVDANTQFQTESILTVPMLRQNTVLGVVQVINKQNGAPFNEEDQMLLTAFAGQAVVALENARLLEQTDKALQERVRELSLLQQLDRDLNTTLDLDHVLSLTLDWALRICDGSAGFIVLADEEHRLRLEAFRGQDEAFDPYSVDDEALQTGLIGQVFESGEPDVCENIHVRNDELSISDSTHSQMTLPIIHKQKLIGVLAIGSNEFAAFDEAMVESAVRVTNHAAVAIANAILVEQINEANQAKSEFVSIVSHELKTPMTSMRGYTDLMLSGMTGEINEQQRKFLQTIAANINRMSKQIQDLTDISRIETGRLRMEKSPTAFTNIVSETLQSVKGPCDHKNIELHLDLPADLPLVMADKERLVQVLTNLISNACKYSPPDSEVTITLREEAISLKKDQPRVSMVVCSVKDNGYGISEADQKKLFTKFFRAEDPNIRKASGTGLGLSITKGIVEFHGGKIWVESGTSQGTTFHFAIPKVSE